MAAIRLRLLLAIPVALAAGGCASKVPVEGAATPAGGGSTMRWSAQLKQLNLSNNATLTQTSGGGGSGPGATATSYGSIMITPVADTRGRLKYDLSVMAPTLQGQQIAWGLFTGSCNTPSPPVVPVNELPPIDIASSGAGEVRGELSVPLDPRATYHVNVYSIQRATDVNNVLLCAKLSYSGPK